MTTYTIHVQHANSPYDLELLIATFEGYDGAPDAEHPTGLGYTHREAIDDLLENNYCNLGDETHEQNV